MSSTSRNVDDGIFDMKDFPEDGGSERIFHWSAIGCEHWLKQETRPTRTKLGFVTLLSIHRPLTQTAASIREIVLTVT